VTAIAWLELTGPSSPILVPLGWAPSLGSTNPLYSPSGIALLLGIEHAPLVFLALRAGLRSIPPDLVEAARAAGASPLRVLATVILPLMAPALGAGLALAFVSSIGNFGTPALLGIPAKYPMLTTAIYQRLAGFGPRVLAEVASLSLVLGALALLGIVVQQMLVGRRDLRLASTGIELSPWSLGRWRGVAEGVIWLGLAGLLIVPLAALLGTALVSAYGRPLGIETVTLANFRFILVEHAPTARALRNSFGLAAGAGLLLVAIAVLLGYFGTWRDSRAARILGHAAELPYAFPGVVLAISCILLFIRPVLGISLYNTVWIILVAYVARFLTLALRPIAAAFRQLDRALEEAAEMTGARLGRRLRTVILPLVAPAAAAGALLVFLTAFNELTVSALLWSSGHETLGVVVFGLEQAGDTVLAAAVASVTVAATAALMVLASGFARWLPRGVLPWQA
jgi:iron(III) transport system permease protein